MRGRLDGLDGSSSSSSTQLTGARGLCKRPREYGPSRLESSGVRGRLGGVNSSLYPVEANGGIVVEREEVETCYERLKWGLGSSM